MGDPLFLNIGITLEVLSKVGKIPISKDLLKRVKIGLAISSFRSLSILTGILWGPADFVSEKESTTLKISSGLVGERNIEFLFLRVFVKCDKQHCTDFQLRH